MTDAGPLLHLGGEIENLANPLWNEGALPAQAEPRDLLNKQNLTSVYDGAAPTDRGGLTPENALQSWKKEANAPPWNPDMGKTPYTAQWN
eukprot:SAG25_NODE_6823_length_527_cov_0.862150_1_plen_90_part_00